jgi:hypothetical protein
VSVPQFSNAVFLLVIHQLTSELQPKLLRQTIHQPLPIAITEVTQMLKIMLTKIHLFYLLDPFPVGIPLV